MVESSQHFEESLQESAIHVVFASTLDNIDRACEVVTRFLKGKKEDITPDLFAINLVLREGLSNAVRHGNQNNKDKAVTLVADLGTPGVLKIRIEDEGKGFDWRRSQAISVPENRESGRGLLIMTKYFSKHNFNEQGNILYLEKALSVENNDGLIQS